MNDNEIGNPPIKALIVFRENGDTDNLFVPILCDAIRTTGIDVRCSTNEFWNSDTPYDIIHFQWPEEVMEGNCDDPDRICRLKECIAFFRSRGARFVYTRHNVRPHDANEVIGRAYDIIEEQSDVVVHMGRYSLDEFAAKHADSRNVIIPHPIYQYTYKEDISVERARQYLNLPQEAFIVTSFGKFRNREERRMVTGAFRKWDEAKKFLLAPRLYPFSRFNRYGSNFFKRWTSRAGYYLLIPLAQPPAQNARRSQRRTYRQLRPALLHGRFGCNIHPTKRYSELCQYTSRLPFSQSGHRSQYREYRRNPPRYGQPRLPPRQPI